MEMIFWVLGGLFVIALGASIAVAGAITIWSAVTGQMY